MRRRNKKSQNHTEKEVTYVYFGWLVVWFGCLVGWVWFGLDFWGGGLVFLRLSVFSNIFLIFQTELRMQKAERGRRKDLKYTELLLYFLSFQPKEKSTAWLEQYQSTTFSHFLFLSVHYFFCYFCAYLCLRLISFLSHPW